MGTLISWRALCIGTATAIALLGITAGTASAANPVTAPFTECPAIGAAPSCEILLVVNSNNTISVLGDPTVGPYDGSDDTLVGVVNNSSKPVPAITVSGSGSGLAGFDGDGICTYATGGITGGSGAGFKGDSYCSAQQLAGTNPEDYAGPGMSFTLDPNSQDNVEVDFAGNGLAAAGFTYFSLEGALTSAVITARPGGLIPAAMSANYSGYVSQYPPDAAISTRVILPSVTCNTAGDVSLWVGYDGWERDSTTVEQDGVSAACDRVGGTPDFYLWYELYKSPFNNYNPCYANYTWCPFYTNPYEIRVPVKVQLRPGDAVDLYVNKIPHGTFHGIPLGTDHIFFSINAYDAAGKAIMKTWSKKVAEPFFFDPKYDSSECIAEAPEDSHGLYALPDFGTVTFANCSPIDAVTSPSSLLRVNMVRNGKTLAATNVFQRNGNGENSFSVTWLASK